MTVEMPARALDVDLLARELGNWRTSSRSGPAYHGLADAIRLLIVDGRIPVGARLPSERAHGRHAAGFPHHRHRRICPAARGRLSQRPPRRPQHHRTPGRTRRANRDRLADDEPGRRRVVRSRRRGERGVRRSHPRCDALSATRWATNSSASTFCERPIAERYCERGLPTEPDEVLITTGALHAINLILTTYVQPGDRVLVEQPTYHGALSSIVTAGARPVPVAMTEDGWELDALQSAVHQLSPSLAYLIPDNQNPTGLTMPARDRKRLAAIIAETRTRTIIDETILDMWLDEQVPAPMAAAMTTRRDLVLTVGSMSKSFWGGLRVGWIRAERATIATIAALRPSIDMGTPVLEQFAAARLLAQRDELLPERREILRARRAFLLSLLDRHLPDWEPGAGAGGMSLWVRLPAPMSTALSAAASRMGLELPAGPRFGVDGTLERFVRVPYALPEEELSAAVELLARAWHSVTGSSAPEPTTVVV